MRQADMDDRTCIWPECDRIERKMARRLCAKHYQRSRDVGHVDSPWDVWTDGRPKGSPPCRWPECEAPGTRRKLCGKHYSRARTVDDFTEPWVVWNLPLRCRQCGGPYKRTTTQKLYCSAECARDSLDPAVAKKRFAAYYRQNRERYFEHSRRRRAKVRGVKADAFTDADVRALHGDDCYLCGKRIDFTLAWPHPKSPTVDHVIPLSRGGEHTLENCAYTHWVCNHKKGARLTSKRPQPGLLMQ